MRYISFCLLAFCLLPINGCIQISASPDPPQLPRFVTPSSIKIKGPASQTDTAKLISTFISDITLFTNLSSNILKETENAVPQKNNKASIWTITSPPGYKASTVTITGTPVSENVISWDIAINNSPFVSGTSNNEATEGSWTYVLGREKITSAWNNRPPTISIILSMEKTNTNETVRYIINNNRKFQNGSFSITKNGGPIYDAVWDKKGSITENINALS